MIETKKITDDKREIIEMYKAFGWEETGVEPGKKKKDPGIVSLARDTDMAHYKEVKVFESTFDAHTTRMKKVPELDYFFAVLFFLLAIIPGLIYVAYIKSARANAIKYNEEQMEYLKNMCKEAKRVRGL